MLIKQPKILLTGASGFLGSYMCNYLNQEYDVITLGRNESSSVICNISNNSIVLDDYYNMVIHAAGKAHSFPKSEQERNEFYDVNYKGTVNLCKSLESKLPLTFVFISTIAVYGLEKGSDIFESHPLLGNTSYAKSKILAEEFLQKWCKNKKVNLVILRLPLVAGGNPKGNLESMIDGIRKGYYFNIAGNKAKKSIVLADDVAKLIPNLYGKNGIYNLSGDQDYTFDEIATIISGQLKNKKVLKLPYLFVLFLAKIGDYLTFLPINSTKLKKMMSNLTVSCEKATKELSWSPSSLVENFKII